MSAGRASRALLAGATVAFAAIVVLSACGAEKRPAPPNPAFATPDPFADAVWDDGRAEIAVYRGTMPRYGTPRPARARIIVVKEDLDVAQRVKSDGPPAAGRTRPVLKMNTILDFPTGTYDYHQMSSVFVDRESGALEKLAMSSTEGCGITYVEVLPRDAAWRHVSHSYWDGEADRELTLALRTERPTLAADALPLLLRRYDLARAATFPADLLPTQLSSRVAAPALVPATIEIAGRPDAHGLPVTVRSVDARGAPRVDRYWFDPASPHGLVRLERADGLVLERAKALRLAYWEKTAPGDEKLLEP